MNLVVKGVARSILVRDLLIRRIRSDCALLLPLRRPIQPARWSNLVFFGKKQLEILFSSVRGWGGVYICPLGPGHVSQGPAIPGTHCWACVHSISQAPRPTLLESQSGNLTSIACPCIYDYSQSHQPEAIGLVKLTRPCKPHTLQHEKCSGSKLLFSK